MDEGQPATSATHRRAPALRPSALTTIKQSESALESLYRAQLPTVFGFARARLSEADAEDVTAEVFCAAAECLEREPARELTRSWLLTATRNRIIDRWRHHNRWNERISVLRRDADRTADDPGDGGPDHVLDALDHLPEPQRAVLVLRYVEQMPSAEIASALGRSVTAVDSLLARARRGLISAYEEVHG